VELALKRLEHGGIGCRSRVVDSEADFRNALQQRLPGVILSDCTLPSFDGMSALAIANQIAPEVPGSTRLSCASRIARR
jgi:hypothetical protein